MIDTHSHIQFKIFDRDRDEIVQQSLDAGVEAIIVVGTDLESSKKAIEVAKKYPSVFASVGIHPHHVFRLLPCHPEERSDVRILLKEELCSQNQAPNARKIATLDDSLAMTLNELESLLTLPKVVAVGETGLDAHPYPMTKYQNYQITKEFLDLQKKVFTQQIKLAIKYQKTLIIHNRGTEEKLLEILEANWDPFLSGRSVFHCCEPNKKLLDFAKKYRVFIGVDGDVTYDKTKQGFVRQVPPELLVLETDSPFFIPEPMKSQGKTINTPENITQILHFLDSLLKKNVQEMSRINSTVLFKLPL